MNTKISARLMAMSDSEIMGMVSPRTVRDIKREDPRPKFLAFVVGHEGDAMPQEKGVGQVITRWYRSAIEALTSKLGLGAPVYHGHVGGDPNQARPAIGEVVGKLTQKIGDAISSIAVTYIFPQYRDLPFDVASIEAMVSVPENARQFDVEGVDIQAITGIALGNSAVDKPAFPGATLLAQLTAFAEKQTHEEKNMAMTLEQIKAAIQENKLQPSDVFASQVLISDPLVQERIEDMKDNLKMAGIRKLRESEEKVVALEAEKKTLAEKLKGHENIIIKTRAKETFEAVLAERPKLKEDERLVKFIRKQFDKSFTPTEEAKLKDELNRFVDSQVGEFTELFSEPKPGEKVPPRAKPAGERVGERADGDEGEPLLDIQDKSLIPKD